jgi:bisphosphoglycerate-independent phosphoglycerate mutase (AlkP superfamily)
VSAFDALFYAVDTTKSGMHHRDGMLWIRPPKGISGRAAPGHVPLESLAPTMLSMLGLHPTSEMKGAVLTGF